MAEFPALPLFTDAYLADTRHLTTEEHGAYLLLMIEAWRRPDCNLPDDDKMLARLSGIGVARWPEIKPVVMAFWVRDGRRKVWTQKRLLKERSYVAQKSALQREKAAKRWKAEEKSDAVAKPNGCQGDAPTPTPTPTPTEDGGGGVAREAAKTDREAILDAIGVDPVSGLTGPNGWMLGTQADMAEVARWLDLPGITVPIVLAEVRRIMAGKRDGPPSSFRFFTKAIQRLSGEISRPALDPITQQPTSGGKHDRQRFDQAINRIADGLSSGAIQLDVASRDPFAPRPGSNA